MEPTHKTDSSDRPRMAGGIFIFLGLLLGAIIGTAVGQPSLGMVSGLGIGAGAALGVWLIDRNRSKKG